MELTLKEFGNKQVLLKENQEVQLIAKSNRQAYIYLVGHTLHDDEKFSYLVELQEASGDERFLYTLGADSVNRPIPLPLNFTVSEPFGYESIQMFASTSKPELPSCKPKGDFCVIGDQPQISSSQNTSFERKTR